MLLANYASDSDSDQEDAGPSRPTPLTTSMGGGGGASKPKRKAPVKITLDLPKTTSTEPNGGEAEAEEEEEREFKKAKTGSGPKGGKGSSALLGMLPPPKRKLPASKSGPSTNKPTIAVPKVALPKPAANLPAPPGFSKEDSDIDDGGMVPPSLRRKGAAGTSKGASMDLFGLGDEPSASSSSSKPKPKSTSSMPMSISSAPTVADFIPPQPTANDPYPGYYQTPSGEWAAYDQDYYHTFFPAQTQEELEQGDGRVGRHWEEFNSKGADFIDIDVSKGLEEARIERERKALAVKPKLPGDEVEYKAVGQIKGLATERHQLSSLLNTAFTQKEELEQRITSNKKNMRVAAQKYGF